ncbi:MAG: stage II sporulation protein P [Lachnospiraceae bacterium]
MKTSWDIKTFFYQTVRTKLFMIQNPYYYLGLNENILGSFNGTATIEIESELAALLIEESHEEKNENVNLDIDYESEGLMKLEEDLATKLKEENEAKEQAFAEQAQNEQEEIETKESIENENTSQFVKATEKQVEYQWDYYANTNNLINDFYAVDASTMIKESWFEVSKLKDKDLSIVKNKESGPQILIYHTHSQESFADSVAGDTTTTILGAGEELARILEEEYGYSVMHHTGQYDVESRDYAYSTALPSIEQLLAENPSIEVVIDLHRDEMREGKKLLVENQESPMAQVMFFNGLSRTKEQGDISYLENPYIEDNLAFSFQMQVLCNEYYPGLARRIYLKGYRYNMHVAAKTLLVELGAQTNTTEEIWNALLPLAHVLDMVLS